MQIYFGNIRIDVTNNTPLNNLLFNQDEFLQFLNKDSNHSINLSIIRKDALDSFCKILVEKWPQVKKGKNLFLNLSVYSFAELFDSFSKVLKIVHACGGIVYNNNKEVMLMQRMGMWDLPKGKLEVNESFETCAIREVQEETNIKATVLDYWNNTYHTYDTYGELSLKITHWYEMKYHSGELIPQVEESIQKLEWINLLHLEKYKNKTYQSLWPVFDKF